MKTNIEEARKELQKIATSASNKKDLLELDMRGANSGLSINSREAYFRAWFTFAKYLGKKNFRNATPTDIDNYLYRLRKGDFSQKNSQLSSATIQVHTISLKKLYKALYPDSSGTALQIRHLKTIKCQKDGIRKLEKDDLLTPTEIERMVHAVKNTQWKALIRVLFESGFRISELLSMTIDSVAINKEEALVRINASKTKTRSILIISALPELRAWIQIHPHNTDPKAPLWIANEKCMHVRTAQYIVRQAAKLAGIKKRVFPHLLRHSIITWRRRMGMLDEEVKMFAGWTKGSNMIERYSHFNIDDMLNRQRKQAGVDVGEPKDEKPLKTYEICPVCEKRFPVGYTICDQCSMPLDSKKKIRKVSRSTKTIPTHREHEKS